MWNMVIPRPKEVWLDDVRKRLNRVLVAPQFYTEQEKLQVSIVLFDLLWGDMDQALPKLENLVELMKEVV